METIYRKVAVSERKPLKSGSYYTNIDKSFYRKSTGEFEDNNDSYIVYPTFWLEEIPDNTQQIEKLEADKAELLEALEKVRISLLLLPDEFSDEINSIIQKHKQ